MEAPGERTASAGEYRAFRFLLPEIDAPELEAGLTVAATGGIAMVEGHASVRQAVLLLLATVPGERVMRPDYGCDLHRLMFLPNDATTAGMAIHYVRQALERWEPRVEILRLDANRSEAEPIDLQRAKDELARAGLRGDVHRATLDESKLIIMLEYRVRATQRVEGFRLPINLSGE
jgi:phage baseplate assembly protein W